MTLSNALVNLFLSLDTSKSTEEWYRVERERVAGIQSWCSNVEEISVITREARKLRINIASEKAIQSERTSKCNTKKFRHRSLSLACNIKYGPRHAPCRTLRRWLDARYGFTTSLMHWQNCICYKLEFMCMFTHRARSVRITTAVGERHVLARNNRETAS